VIICATATLLLLFGVPLGVLSARHPHSWVVTAARRAVGSVSSLPVLVWSTLIVLAVTGVLRTPVGGSSPAELLASAPVLGAAVLGLLLGDRLLADIVRRVEISTREILQEPYMRTVRAADLGTRRHLAQSLVPPVANVVVSRSLFLIGGAIVVERVFAIPGLGFSIIDALERPEQDQALILAASIALVGIGLLFRIARQAAVAIADPRART
jgi:peptide/nickel transport system permease protein